MSNGGRRANNSSIGMSEEFDLEAPKLETVAPALNSISLHPNLIKIKPSLLWPPILICCLAITRANQKAASGFYQVELETHKATVSIASRQRSSVVPLDYLATDKANLLWMPPNKGTAISNSSLTIAPDAREVSGRAASGDFSDAPSNPAFALATP